MKGLLQVFATVVVVLVSMFCLLVQVSHVGHAADQISHDESAAGTP